MKYIRAQDGRVFSISQLIPPMKRQSARGGEVVEIWSLKVITIDGSRETYATFESLKEASECYKVMCLFMADAQTLYTFRLTGTVGNA